MVKSSQLQIRVSHAQKEKMRNLAEQAGQDVSQWVLQRLLPPCVAQLQALIDNLKHRPGQRSLILAELHDFLVDQDSKQLTQALQEIDVGGLAPFEANYVAAMIETACTNRNIVPPPWVARVKPCTEPWFASNLTSLRMYLLTASPPPFRKRNLFVDSTLGARV